MATRALDEYRAVAVVSGRLVDKTQTVTLLVQPRFQNFYHRLRLPAGTDVWLRPPPAAASRSGSVEGRCA